MEHNIFHKLYGRTPSVSSGSFQNEGSTLFLDLFDYKAPRSDYTNLNYGSPTYDSVRLNEPSNFDYQSQLYSPYDVPHDINQRSFYEYWSRPGTISLSSSRSSSIRSVRESHPIFVNKTPIRGDIKKRTEYPLKLIPSLQNSFNPQESIKKTEYPLKVMPFLEQSLNDSIPEESKDNEPTEQDSGFSSNSSLENIEETEEPLSIDNSEEIKTEEIIDKNLIISTRELTKISLKRELTKISTKETKEDTLNENKHDSIADFPKEEEPLPGKPDEKDSKKDDENDDDKKKRRRKRILVLLSLICCISLIVVMIALGLAILLYYIFSASVSINVPEYSTTQTSVIIDVLTTTSTSTTTTTTTATTTATTTTTPTSTTTTTTIYNTTTTATTESTTTNTDPTTTTTSTTTTTVTVTTGTTSCNVGNGNNGQGVGGAGNC